MSGRPQPAKILIADDHPMIVFALVETLKSALSDRNVQVNSVSAGDSLLSRLTSEAADYLVMDLHMPGRLNSVPLLQAVLNMQPQLKVTIYTGAHLPCLARSCLELGARAFVSKASGPEVANEAIAAVVAGKTYVDPTVDMEVANKHPWYELTTGEREVLIALARGGNLQAIAIDSNRSYKTVTTHKYNAFRKLKLRSKDEVGHYLVQNGFDYLLK